MPSHKPADSGNPARIHFTMTDRWRRKSESRAAVPLFSPRSFFAFPVRPAPDSRFESLTALGVHAVQTFRLRRGRRQHSGERAVRFSIRLKSMNSYSRSTVFGARRLAATLRHLPTHFNRDRTSPWKPSTYRWVGSTTPRRPSA